MTYFKYIIFSLFNLITASLSNGGNPFIGLVAFIIVVATWWLFCYKLYLKHSKLWFFVALICEIVLTIIICIMLEGIFGPI